MIDAERIAARMDEMRLSSEAAKRELEKLVTESQGLVVRIDVVVVGMRSTIQKLNDEGHGECAKELERFANALSFLMASS